MLQLPVELRRQCLDYLKDDTKALRAVRLAHSQLRSLATEILFRTATLNHTDESAEKLTCLVQSPLHSMVRCVVINTSTNPKIMDEDDEDDDDANILKSFGKAIAIVCILENLEEVVLNFERECTAPESDSCWDNDVKQDADFRNEVWGLLLTAVRQVEVKSLVINNLQDYMDKAVFESEDFKAVRDRVTQLHLRITTESEEASPASDIDFPALHEGFGRDLPNIWLRPLTNQLTHLTLYGNDYWGLWPFVDLRKVPPFPCLKSLSLGNFTIAHDWQIDWILAHASTLQELLLDDCPIIVALSFEQDAAHTIFPDLPPLKDVSPHITNDPESYFKIVDLRWHHVLDRFCAHLPKLQHFAIGSGDWNTERAFEERYELITKSSGLDYLVFDYGTGPSSWQGLNDEWSFYVGGTEHYEFKFLRYDEEGERALANLLEAVKVRAIARA
ncbi:uncharacterized protein K460DRAFT_363529 [Cucurbitaria berberidis CBS 394.84]|uniref:F-box domain-containing protein n=1 Tax=Cucurbitaria berberidis CBS 394.84 TaxID=1168544 RepID=A0A9P4GKR7_9PLEO|nr:uncharacterized protein K460DRAFT_363529 [Cucurbitaria berberidis CBS 394.84]KAF1847457.1 hypothetical protein K460DRAFT_363529 [Cucurbitaria berberidis CBS 394.84]